MRRSAAAFALFRRDGAAGSLWLAQWNRKWQAFNVIGGDREIDESARDCALREVEEELSLTRGVDFYLSETPLVRIEFEAFSMPTGEQTHYEMELFAAEFVGEGVVARVMLDSANRWLTPDEIAVGHVTDGRSVSDVTQRFFRALATND